MKRMVFWPKWAKEQRPHTHPKWGDCKVLRLTGRLVPRRHGQHSRPGSFARSLMQYNRQMLAAWPRKVDGPLTGGAKFYWGPCWPYSRRPQRG